MYQLGIGRINKKNLKKARNESKIKTKIITI